jgi:phage terminase large subunit-like protein
MKKKTDMGSYEFSALYQQTPIDEENRKFKQAWFQYRKFEDIEQQETYNVMTIDPKGTEDAKRGNDYVGITLNFVDSQGNWNIISDRMKISATELINIMFTYWQKYKLHKIGIEDNQFTQGLKISWEEQSRVRGVFPYVELAKHGGTQKELRIEALVPRYERGGIYHLTVNGINQCTKLEDELMLFPKSTNDDASDSLAYQTDLAVRPIDQNVQKQYKPLDLVGW